MKESMTRSHRLASKLSQLFDLESNIDTVLSVSMYHLNQFMNSERSSVFLFRRWNQQLTVFSSLDLERNEIRMPKSCGVVGWVFVNQQPAIVNDAYEDSRFYKMVDDMTGFHTRNLVCTPLLDSNDHCLGTLQSLNKKSGDFTTNDLDLLNLAARIVAVAIKSSNHYTELLVVNNARKKFIEQVSRNKREIYHQF